MECLHSMAPNDEELLRLALDDEPLSSASRKHLEHCSLCQQRLTRYKYTNAFFLTNLYRSECPGATQLNQYCASLLPVDDMITIVEHLQVCPLCTQEVDEIRNVLTDFEPFIDCAVIPHASVTRIVAVLIPWQPQLVMRSEVAEAPWPRQYRAGAINISLHLSRAANGEKMLLGLFTSADPTDSIEDLAGIPVELYAASISYSTQRSGRYNKLAYEPLRSDQIDDLGNVVFKAVPSGEYRMIVRLPKTEVVIEGLTIC